jgi:hypothetical protein
MSINIHYEMIFRFFNSILACSISASSSDAASGQSRKDNTPTINRRHKTIPNPNIIQMGAYKRNNRTIRVEEEDRPSSFSKLDFFRTINTSYNQIDKKTTEYVKNT